MTLETAWLLLLGALLAGYFVLGGYDYGTQMLLPRGPRAAAGRRTHLAALGPFFLGNEVWLVAFAGVLFGAFPFLEGTLLSGLYPLLVPLLAALAAGKAAVLLRGRAHGRAAERAWDALVVLGGAVPALLWGAVIGVLVQGVPLAPGGTSFALGADPLLAPVVAVCAVLSALLCAAHGAAFLALRARGPAASRARALMRPLTAAALAAAAAAVLAGAAAGVGNPAAAAAVAVLLAAATAGARAAARRRRPGAGFACTSAAMALLAVAPGVAHFPYVLASSTGPGGMSLADAAADGATLAVLSGFGVAVVPLMLAYQAAGWWAFRGRVDHRSPSYL
ncbi:cytochrome d ubiquinol oxidase subunit II [Nocardiopsis sp. CNT-189]|uniref:cytochrome d ubiquinol oxidase subunit II n=1 Tax=Nocardiopsis oceanisediminis TaxID=2816862 RepID=UPI003B34E41E